MVVRAVLLPYILMMSLMRCMVVVEYAYVHVFRLRVRLRKVLNAAKLYFSAWDQSSLDPIRTILPFSYDQTARHAR